MKLNYQQRYIAYSAGLVVLIMVWYLGFYDDQKGKIAQMRAETIKINNDIKRAASSSGRIKVLQDDIEVIKKDVEKMKEKIPSKDRLLYVTKTIERIAKQYGLKLLKISPEKNILFSEEDPGSSIIKIPINIWVVGRYFNLGKFIESFDNFPFLLKAGSITISGDDDNYPELDIFFEVNAYLYK